MVYLSVTSFSDRSVGLEARCDLVRMVVQYIDIGNEVIVNHVEVGWVERKLVKLRYGAEELNRVFQTVFASHRTSELYNLHFSFFGSCSRRLGEIWKHVIHGCGAL